MKLQIQAVLKLIILNRNDIIIDIKQKGFFFKIVKIQFCLNNCLIDFLQVLVSNIITIYKHIFQFLSQNNKNNTVAIYYSNWIKHICESGSTLCERQSHLLVVGNLWSTSLYLAHVWLQEEAKPQDVLEDDVP